MDFHDVMVLAEHARPSEDFYLSISTPHFLLNWARALNSGHNVCIFMEASGLRGGWGNLPSALRTGPAKESPKGSRNTGQDSCLDKRKGADISQGACNTRSRRDARADRQQG